MKIAGILGGLGPESTIDYYRSIIALYRHRDPNHASPQLLIHSLDVDHGIALLNANRHADLADYLSSGIDVLARAGATFALVAANTPHIVFPELERRSPIPLLSIVRATAEHAKSLGLKKVGLFGTGFTMNANFYPEEFDRHAITIVRPTEEERAFIHQKYIGELLKNQFLPPTRDAILQIANRLVREDGVEAIALAGTELPLLLRDSPATVRFLDTTVIHVEATVTELLK